MQYRLRGLRLVRNLSPVIALILGGGLLYVFVQREFWSIVGPLAGFTVGSLIMIVWLVIRPLRETQTERPAGSPQFPVQIPVIVTCLFIVLMFGIFRFYIHQRPVAQYFLFGGFAGFIGYQVAGGGSHKRVVPQMLVLGFLTYWSSQLLFPAGMYGIDTRYGYIPQINGIISSGYYPGTGPYMGHLLHTAEFAALTGIQTQTAYFLFATSLLTGTILILSILDRTLPSLSKEAALFTALVFTISSWTIGRGMHPNKLNFFYPLIVLLGIAAIHLYQAVRSDETEIRRWFTVGLWVIPAIVFGHRFSAGAALMFLLAIFTFAAIGRWIFTEEYSLVSRGFLGALVAIYFLAVVGNPLHQDPLVGRLSSLITSVITPAGSGSGAGGPGRFSQLQLDVLIASTAAQAIIFALAVIGAIWMFRQRKWEHDIVLFWIVCLGAFLGVALLQNSVDTAPQRFYGVLMLFGFNIAIAVAFDVLRTQGTDKIWRPSAGWGRLLVTTLVVLLAVTSLVSPIAERATSPVSDEIPDIRQFDTEPLIEGDEWAEQYAVDEVRIIAPTSDVPIERVGPRRGVVNRTAIEPGTEVVYSEWSERRGVGTSRGQTLGGSSYVFVSSPERPTDNRIYANGETSVFSIY